MTVKIGSLFSGIGGLDLACERVFGGDTVWQVEQEPYCQRVLESRWPNAQRHSDVRKVGAHNLEPIDVLCGGFPCQDLSHAGLRKGLDGHKSGLYSELLRITAELNPRYVAIENVPALVYYRDRVYRDFESLGYGMLWQECQASDAGAPHRRRRVFVLAVRGMGRSVSLNRPAQRKLPNPWPTPTVKGNYNKAGLSKKSGDGLATAAGGCLNPAWVETLMGFPAGWTDPSARTGSHAWPMARGDEQAPHEPPRLVSPRSTPHRKERLKALGNAVVPQQGILALQRAKEASNDDVA